MKRIILTAAVLAFTASARAAAPSEPGEGVLAEAGSFPGGLAQEANDVSSRLRSLERSTPRRAAAASADSRPARKVVLEDVLVAFDSDGLNVSDDEGRVKVGRRCTSSVGGPVCWDIFEGGTIYWLNPSDKVSRAALDAAENRRATITGTARDGGSAYYGYNVVDLTVESLIVR
jgi:hypothetical protein